MDKRGLMAKCPPFHQADKTLDDIRFLQLEPQLTQHGMFQQVIDRPLPVTGKEIGKECLVIQSDNPIRKEPPYRQAAGNTNA